MCDYYGKKREKTERKKEKKLFVHVCGVKKKAKKAN